MNDESFNELEVLEDRSAVEQVAMLAMAASDPKFLDAPDPNDHRRFFLDENGQLGNPPYVPPRRYTALSVSGLIDTVRDLASIKQVRAFGAEDVSAACRIFVGDDRVTAVIDERGDRTDAVVLHLKTVASMTSIENGALEDLDQSFLEWILRSEFPDRVTPESFLPIIRKLKFRDGAQGGSSIGHGNETIDLEVEASVSGVDENIPEVVTLKTPVFEVLATDQFAYEVPIRCAVRVVPKTKKFFLRPLEGQITSARQAARNEIVSMIADANLPDNVLVFRDAAV